jgi:anti-anti-sigma regulatory factor
MITIDKTSYGLRLTFRGLWGVAELRAFAAEFDRHLADLGESFAVFVDMRALPPISPDGVPALVDIQRQAKEHGMTRSVVITTNPATIQQFQRIAGDSAINRTERYINAAAIADWEQIGLDWLLHGIEPPIAASSAAPRA